MISEHVANNRQRMTHFAPLVVQDSTLTSYAQSVCIKLFLSERFWRYNEPLNERSRTAL